jgi:uncharacterized repeat protein (TIGR04052 family)
VVGALARLHPAFHPVAHHSMSTIPALLLTALASAAPVTMSSDSLAPVTIRLQAMVGAQPFACGTAYDGIGRTGARVTASDFRFYVHDVRLVNAHGDTVRAALQARAPWQDADVALLDFEDGSATCANGTPETNGDVVVMAPPGEYRGVAFTLGVPFGRNHGELSTQAPPLSLSRLFWSWNGGYKFMRVDMRASQGDSAATGWVIHLGSTGCTVPEGAKSPTVCAQPNRAHVALGNFDPSRDVIVADLAALLAASDVRSNQPQTALGCMSAPTDVDCGGLFASLGLAHPSADASTARPFFRVQRASTTRATSTNH